MSGNRKRPLGSSGALAALLISPRAFGYFICKGCMRDLFYTYEGEECPFCGAVVDWYVEGGISGGRGRARVDFRARAAR